MSNDTEEHAQVSGAHSAPELSVFTTPSQRAAVLGLSAGAKDGEAPSTGKLREKLILRGSRAPEGRAEAVLS